eukprot:1265562-Pyramimonas_sp.AAC.1
MPTTVAGRLKKYGFRPQPRLEVLGLEVGAGKPCYGHVLKRHMRKVGKRAGHFKRLRALGAKFKRVARAAVGPAITYGLSILGAAPHVLRRMTAMVKHGWDAIPS